MRVNQRSLPREKMKSLTLLNLRMSSTAYGRNLRQPVRGTTTLQGIGIKGKSNRLKPQQSCRKFAGSITQLKVAKGVVTNHAEFNHEEKY